MHLSHPEQGSDSNVRTNLTFTDLCNHILSLCRSAKAGKLFSGKSAGSLDHLVAILPDESTQC